MTPIVLIPGLLATPDFYAAQMPAMWPRAAVQVANHARDETMAAIARRVLDEAPERFALVGHSMWAATSPSRCFGRRRSGSIASHCSALPRARTHPSSPSAGVR